MLQAPDWFVIDAAARSRLRYIWDDARGSDDIRTWPEAAEAVLRTSLRVAPRARMALAVGLFEWLVWRFDVLHQRKEPQQLVQAAWCAVADPRYLRFFELSREDWRGPVAGPLWAATARLRPALAHGLEYPGDLLETLTYLTHAALHVQPLSQPLLNWLDTVLPRLPSICPPVPDDPFVDLFGRDPGPRLGAPLGRAQLDPSQQADAGGARRFLEQVLVEARTEANPFLTPPDELADLGFTGAVYVVSR